MKFTTVLIIALVAVLPTLSAVCAETQPNSTATVTSESTSTYYVEISISRNLLTLYENKERRREDARCGICDRHRRQGA